ncbi:MAG TPA: GNAT family N-acetyltransferase [Chthoniobacterales bacterium]|nr:GNAT family N-acetyltransferase [Chthoniobacterales bacterium]
MSAVQIDYLADHPEYLPQLAQWQLEEWGPFSQDETLETRTAKLKTHMNRDKLSIAWVGHSNGQLLGSAALRVHDLEGREDLGPWLGGVIVGLEFRRQGIGEALCAVVEKHARLLGIETLYLFTLDKAAWYSRLGWTAFEPCLWHGHTCQIMRKQLAAA